MKLLQLIILFSSVYNINAQVSDFKTVDFKKADRVALSCNKDDLSNLPQLSYKLTNTLNTDVERFRAIYMWVCSNIANDYNLYLKNSIKRQRFKDDSIKSKTWSDKFRKLLFKKLERNQRTICTGYAYLVKELAELADIECEIVQGYGRVSTTDIDKLNLPNHSWNAVKLNNKWYLCDPTWASGIPNPETNRFQFKYNDGFFLAEPKLFAINHFPLEKKWWLLNIEPPTFNDFLQAPVIYGNAYDKLILHISPKRMHHEISLNETLAIKLRVKEPIAKNQISFLVDNGSSSFKISPTNIEIKDNTVTLNHRFKSKGFYDLHLYIDDHLISTYTVKVSK